jgi:hypothetical protein
MIEVFGDHTQRVQKRTLRELEPDPMLGPIGPVLGSVPKSGIGTEPSIGM